MDRKSILILLVITAVTFGNSLFNGFVGDDEIFILDNKFYQSWGNYSKIFTQDYFAKQVERFTDTGVVVHNFSGSVAYRPVLSTTYFIDYWIWKLNPFGYHLQNLFCHNHVIDLTHHH